MFVIVESLRQLTPKERALPVEERIGLMLKHAGVSITVTSVTDIVAFAIGGSTVGFSYMHIVKSCIQMFYVLKKIFIFDLKLNDFALLKNRHSLTGQIQNF